MPVGIMRDTMFLDKEINKLFNNMKERTKFINVFILGPELNRKQKRKKNKCWAWAGLVLVIYLGVLVAINQWFELRTNVSLVSLITGELSNLLLFSFIILIPLLLIVLITLNKIASIYEISTNGISALYDHFHYAEFQKWLHNSYISDDTVWNFVLPYVEKQKEIKNEYSFSSFFRAFLPSISVSIPVAILSMMVAIWIADPEAKEMGEEAFNIIFITFLMSAVVVIIYAIIVYKLLPLLLRLFDSTGSYQKLEYLIYAYFFEKEREKRWR